MSRALLQQALEFAEAQCGNRCNAEYNPCEARELATKLQAALAQPEPEPEPVAEVAGEWNAMHIKFLQAGINLRLGDKLYAAAGAAPVPEWISVADQMPASGVTVLACYRNSHNLTRRVRAMWVAAKSVESNFESEIGEYDDASDTYYDPEGWYEKIDNWEEFTALWINHPVTHWMPMPAAPKEAA